MLTKEKCDLEQILGATISREEAYNIILSSPTALELFNGMKLKSCYYGHYCSFGRWKY